MPSSEEDALPEGLLLRLQTAGREDARAALREAVRRPGADAAALAGALLRQQQAQLRAHGLLVARLAGRADLILPALTAEGCGDAGTWKAAAALLCQMDVGPETTAALLQWLLADAPPVQRCYFLTTLGRLPPRPLGAALFEGLLAAGRPQCALRLVRHADMLSDEQMVALAQQHLVDEQEAREAAPTWRRQAWKRLAVARPALAVQLLGELWAKVQAAGEQDGVTATTMLRRAVLALLHGTTGRQAAEALLVSRESFNKDCLESRSQSWGGVWGYLGSLRPLDRRLLFEGGFKAAASRGRRARRSAGSDNAPFQWFHLWRQLELLKATAGSGDGAGSAEAATGGNGIGGSTEAVQQAARVLFIFALESKRTQALRWLMRLHRHGLLGPVLQQTTLQGLWASWDGQFLQTDAVDTLERAVRLAVGGSGSGSELAPGDAESLMAAIAAGDAGHALRHKLQRAWKAAASGEQEEAAEAADEASRHWLAWPIGSKLESWPPHVLASGLDMLEQQRSDAPWRPPLAELSPERLARGQAAEEAVFESVRSYLEWRPALRDRVLASELHQPLADERAAAYRDLLQHSVPRFSAAAVNDVVPWVLRRARNERAQVRVEVLRWMGARVLRVLEERHLPQLEAALESALAAPDSGWELRAMVGREASIVLSLGVQRPASEWLPAGLRLHASLLRRCSSREDESDGGPWSASEALEYALDPEALEGSSDLRLAAVTLLDQLLPLYHRAGHQAAEEALLSRLACSHKALAPLRQLPELAAAVQAWLARRFVKRGSGAAGGQSGSQAEAERETGEMDVDGSDSSGADSPRDERGGAFPPGGGHRRGKRGRPLSSDQSSDTCTPDLDGSQEVLSWWLSDPDEGTVLQRAQSLLAQPQHCALPVKDRMSPAARLFLGTKLCGEWLQVAAGGASPAALWWQQQVSGDDGLLETATSQQQEACWRSVESGGALGAALLAGKPQLRTLLGRAGASKHWLKVLRASGPASQQLLAQRWVLKELLASDGASEGRQLLREPAGAALLQALLREQLWASGLLGVCPAYDSAALEQVFSKNDSEKRRETLERLMEGFARSSTQPRRQPTAKGGHFSLANPGDDSMWSVRRHLESTDLRRWPPAVQALLRRLFSAVAAAPDAEPCLRNAAAIRLARLQDSSPADLEPLLIDAQMHACLLVAADLPDKRATARFLASLMTKSGLAGLAGSAFSGLQAFLPAAFLEELCGDLLSTAGLQTSAWHHTVNTLLERGTPGAIDLAAAEMERPDLSPSMCCGLLSASCHLTALPRVRAFWERCAAAPDEQTAAGVLQLADACMLEQDSGGCGVWWAGLVLRMLRSAEPRERRIAFAKHVTASSAWRALNGTQPAAQALLDGLFSMAAAMPSSGWDAALALLCDRRGKQWDQAALRRHMQPLLCAAAEELQTTGGASDVGSTGTAVCLVLVLAQFQYSPWQLGCRVPDLIARLLWASYCSHLADSALGEDLKSLAADGGAERLAAAASEGLAAAPSATHVMQLAVKLVEQLGLGRCYLDTELQALAAEAALAAARSLAAGAQGSADAGGRQAERSLLVAALAAGAWRLIEEAEAEASRGMRRDALALLRQRLHTPGSLVPLLLDHNCCGQLRSEALGIEEAELEMFAHYEVYGRGCAAGAPRRGHQGRRLALDPTFLSC